MSGHESNDPNSGSLRPTRSFAGVDLVDLVEAPAPFATLFLAPGPDSVDRARLAIEQVPAPVPYARLLSDAVDDSTAGSQIVVVDAGGNSTVFRIDDPFSADVVRFGDVPALGPLLEAEQMTAEHAVVTVENGVFAVTDFGTDSAPDPRAVVFEAIDQLVDHLRSSDHRLIAVVGADAIVEDTIAHLGSQLDPVRLASYPTTDIDGDLAALADKIVRNAASLAAERRTYELAHFREARRAGLVVEGRAVPSALAERMVRRLLVHDDFDIANPNAVGLPDQVVAEGIRQGVPINMIPHVPDERGPVDGVGAILTGDGAAVMANNGAPSRRQPRAGRRRSGVCR